MADEIPDVVEEVDKNVPDVEEAITPDPPEDKPDDKVGALEAVVTHLAERVDALTAQVAAAVPSPGNEGENPGEIENDHTPVKKPWTHRGFFS